MSALSNYLETALINATLRNTSYTSPATVYLSLHTANPAEDASGAEVAVASGYARQSVAFAAPTDGVTSNSAQKTFTASGGNWGTLTHAAVWDTSAAGNMLFYGALSTSRVINDGDSIVFAIGAVVCSLA